MKSGLEDRNNMVQRLPSATSERVSMKSGLEDRNNPQYWTLRPTVYL